MIGMLIFVLALVLLDLAALRWGVDSTDDINSPAWERRALWAEKMYQQL